MLAHSHPTKHVTAIRKLLIPSLRLLVTTGLLWALSTRVDLNHVKAVVNHVSFAAVGGGRGSTTGDEPVRRAALAYRLGGRDDLSRTVDLAEDCARRAVL